MPQTYDGTTIRLKEDMHTWWAERLTRRISEHEVAHTHEKLHSLLVIGDTIYSYGTHFPMAYVFRHKRGDVRLVLLNGDRWSGASGWGHGTTYDQGIVRNNVEAAGVPCVILPFSALHAAKIDYDTIEPIEVRDDRHTYEERLSKERPGPFALMDDPSGARRPSYSSRYGWHVPTGESTPHLGAYAIGVEADATTPNAVYGYYSVQTGYAPVRVEDPRRAIPTSTGFGEVHGYAGLGSDGWWRWKVRFHWLGDSLIRARTSEYREGRRVNRWAYYISSFDYNEPQAPYFLCEVPSVVKRDGQTYRPKPTTVMEALDWLRPDEVVQAERAGLAVLRQGDIFAIPTAHTTRELIAVTGGPTVQKGKPMVLGTNHAPTHALVGRHDVYGRGRLYHTPYSRDPDHRPLDLGDRKTWYRLVKNTVPVDSTPRRLRINGVQQSGESRAWTLGGNVD